MPQKPYAHQNQFIGYRNNHQHQRGNRNRYFMLSHIIDLHGLSPLADGVMALKKNPTHEYRKQVHFFS